MNRDEAISHIKMLSSALASEFAGSRGERDEYEQNVREALMVLGCTEQEIDAAE